MSKMPSKINNGEPKKPNPTIFSCIFLLMAGRVFVCPPPHFQNQMIISAKSNKSCRRRQGRGGGGVQGGSAPPGCRGRLGCRRPPTPRPHLRRLVPWRSSTSAPPPSGDPGRQKISAGPPLKLTACWIFRRHLCFVLRTAARPCERQALLHFVL